MIELSNPNALLKNALDVIATPNSASERSNCALASLNVPQDEVKENIEIERKTNLFVI